MLGPNLMVVAWNGILNSFIFGVGVAIKALCELTF